MTRIETIAVHGGRDDLAELGVHAPPIDLSTTYPVPDQALGGERDAQAALLETGRYLGVGISNIIGGLSPEAVILGGPVVRAWPLIGAEVMRSVEENSICHGLRDVRIIPSTLGEIPTLMGALSLVLSSKFAAVTTA